MKFTLTIYCDNAAFGESRADETARILREIAKQVERDWLDGFARDSNGNAVGEWRFAESVAPRDTRTGKWHGNQMD